MYGSWVYRVIFSTWTNVRKFSEISVKSVKLQFGAKNGQNQKIDTIQENFFKILKFRIPNTSLYSLKGQNR